MLIIIKKEKSCSHRTALLIEEFLTENKTTTLLIFIDATPLFQINYTETTL
jgi:hypothetical protein